jgi:hypothetical protein
VRTSNSRFWEFWGVWFHIFSNRSIGRLCILSVGGIKCYLIFSLKMYRRGEDRSSVQEKLQRNKQQSDTFLLLLNISRTI